MSERTSEERKRLHLLEWGVIAETGCNKLEVLRMLKMGVPPPNNCFACEEAGSTHGELRPDICAKCPIIWGTEHIADMVFCEEEGSPYQDVSHIANREWDGVERYFSDRMKEAAKRILALPFKGAWAEPAAKKPTVAYDPGVPEQCFNLEPPRTKTLRDLKVGDMVCLRDGCTGVVDKVYSDGFHQFSQVVFPTTDLVSVKGRKREVLTEVTWHNGIGMYTFPISHPRTAWQKYVGKPPMTMTLEWDEEEEEEVSDG